MSLVSMSCFNPSLSSKAQHGRGTVLSLVRVLTTLILAPILVSNLCTQLRVCAQAARTGVSVCNEESLDHTTGTWEASWKMTCLSYTLKNRKNLLISVSWLSLFSLPGARSLRTTVE